METAIISTSVLAMYLDLSTTAAGKFCYNADGDKGNVCRVEVAGKIEISLSQKLQYSFTYDGRRRPASKEALKCSAGKQACEQAYIW